MLQGCNNIYVMSFKVGGDTGLAIVSAINSTDAMQILKNKGRFNCTPEAYLLMRCRKIGIASNRTTEVLLESYVNALGAYELLARTVDALQGETPSFTIGDVETLDAGSDAYVTITGTENNPVLNFGIPRGEDGGGVVHTVNWGNINGTLADQTDLNNALGGKYSKPSGGIPKTDLDSTVQASLGKADTALQEFVESDPTVPSWAKETNKPSYSYSEISGTPTIPSSLDDLSDVDLGNPSDTYVLTYNGNTNHWEAKSNTGGGGGSSVSWGTPGTDYVPLSVDGVSKNLLTGHQSISGKADKVTGATSGHLASLDSNGNLVDSGKSSSDFLPSNTSIPSSIDDLSDVDLGTPTDGDVLTYDGTSHEWVSSAPSGGSSDAVQYTAQSLTDAQKKQARLNQDLYAGDEVEAGVIEWDGTTTGLETVTLFNTTFYQVDEELYILPYYVTSIEDSLGSTHAISRDYIIDLNINGTLGSNSGEGYAIKFNGSPAVLVLNYASISGRHTGVFFASNIRYFYYSGTFDNIQNYILPEFVKDIECASNKTNELSVDSSNIQYPNATAVYNFVKPAEASTIPAGGLVPGITYRLGTVSSATTITLATPEDQTVTNLYHFTFTTASTAPSFTWPNSITHWTGNCISPTSHIPVFKGSTYYEVMIDYTGAAICNEFQTVSS